MKPYRSCGCRAGDGRQLGRKCPKLATKGHGHWYIRMDAPRGADGKRRQLRLGPFETEKEAKAGAVAALGRISDGRHVDDRRTTLAEHLDCWLGWKRGELKPSTAASYQEAVAWYFRPAIGHIRLVDLRPDDIRELYNAMRLINRPGQAGNRSEMLRRLLAARATWHGQRTSTRPLSDARIRRMHAVLRAALSDAETLPVNPASSVKLGKIRRPRPLLWTDARVQEWQQRGDVPSPVMCWSAQQCGQFLDAIEDHRLYSLYHLAAYWGLRRGELAGLSWSDVDLRTRRLHVRGDIKTEDSDRIIVIDQGTADVLAAWRKAQLAERLQWGPAWCDSGRVFTREDGTPLRPGWISERFGTLAARAGLPPCRFHDLRHGAATMLIAAGQPVKLVSAVLGHSTSAFTMDVYAVVADELAEDAAAAIAAFIPRRAAVSHQ